MKFEEKYISFYILLFPQISLPSCLYFQRYWEICVCSNCLLNTLDVKNFEVNLIFLIKFFYKTTSQDKNLNIMRTKRAFKTKQKTFFIVVRAFIEAGLKAIWIVNKIPTKWSCHICNHAHGLDFPVLHIQCFRYMLPCYWNHSINMQNDWKCLCSLFSCIQIKCGDLRNIIHRLRYLVELQKRMEQPGVSSVCRR